MADEALIAAQIVRLFRAPPSAVWELLGPSGPAREGDAVLRDLDGTVVGYARPAARESCLAYAGARAAGAAMAGHQMNECTR